MKKATKILMIIATLIITVSLFVACNTGQHAQDYTVTFNANGGSSVASMTLSKIDAEPVTTRDGYDFAGWYDNADLSGNRITFPYTPTANVTLYAKWTEKQGENPPPDKPVAGYKVSFVTNGGSTVAEITVTSIATEPVTTRDGYEFLGWYDNAAFSGSRIAFPYAVSKATTLYARWEEIAVSNWVQTTLADYETEQNEDGSVKVVSYLGSDENIILPTDANLTFDSSFLYQENPTVKAVCVPSNVEEVNGIWFAYVDGLKEISVADDHPTMISKDGILFSKEGTVLLAYPNGKTVTAYTVPSTVKTVGYSAFNGNGTIEHIVVSEGVEKLDGMCFAGMSKLKTISLPSTLVETGSSCLISNPLLEEVVFPSTLTTCAYTTFNSKCTSLKRVVAPACMRLSGLSALETLEVNGGTALLAGAYSNCTSLTTVILSSEIEQLGTESGSGAFSGCTKLESITLHEGITLVGGSTFSGCTLLKEVEIPSTVKTIGANAFKNCTSLKKVITPEGLTKIGNNAFAGSGVEELRLLSDSITYSLSSLKDMANLKTLYCPAIVLKGSNGLAGGDGAILQNLTIVSGAIVKNYSTTFASLHTLVIGEGVTEIYERAFSACHSLVQITNLSGVEWKPQDSYGASYWDHPAEYRTSASTAFSGVISEEANGFVKYTYNGEVRLLDCDRSITSLSAADLAGYTSIGAYAFIYCAELTSVVIPSNIKSIGIYAFRWCSNISSLTIEEGVQSIGRFAFCPTNGVSSVTIPSSVTTIEGSAFMRSEGYGVLTINVKGKSSAPSGWANDWYSKTNDMITVNWNA